MVCAVIPYKTFKEKIALTKKYNKQHIEIYKNYILVIYQKWRIYGRVKYMGHMHICNANSFDNNYFGNVDNYIYFRWSRQADKEN